MNVDKLRIFVISKLNLKNETVDGKTEVLANFIASAVLPGDKKETKLYCTGKLHDNITIAMANSIELGRNFDATGEVKKASNGYMVLIISSIEPPTKAINKSAGMKKDTLPQAYQTTEPGM